MKVLEPSAGQYEIIVRMDPTLASKFPEKPFGTSITEIGLAAKDADKYEGYTLVSIEPADKGAKDHFWTFQKLSGPEWVTTSNSRENLTPAKYRGQTVVVKTEQEVAPDTQPRSFSPFLEDGVTANPDYNPNLVSSVVTQVPNTGKALLTEVTETIDENAEPLVGKQAYEQRQVVDVIEKLVIDGTDALAGLNAAQKLLIVSDSISPIGNGKSVEQIVKVDAWAELTESEWDGKLKAQLKRTEQFVAPPVVPVVINAENPDPYAEPNTSYKIVNQDRSLKIVEVEPTSVLDNFWFSTPVRVNLGDLPRELVSVNVVWNSNYSIGTQDQFYQAFDSGTSYSLSGSDNDSASSSASIQPDIQLKYRDIASNNLFGVRDEFLLEFSAGNPITVQRIIDRLNAHYGVSTVKTWPVFRPVSETITATSQSVQVRATASAGLGVKVSNSMVTGRSAQKTVSDDFSAGLAVNSLQTPPCIHGAITVTGGTSRSQLVSATALISMFISGAGSNQISAFKTKSGTAYGTVSPTSLPATGGAGNSTIPTSGLFILDFDIQQYEKWNRAMVIVVLFNASVLAP